MVLKNSAQILSHKKKKYRKVYNFFKHSATDASIKERESSFRYDPVSCGMGLFFTGGISYTGISFAPGGLWMEKIVHQRAVSSYIFIIKPARNPKKGSRAGLMIQPEITKFNLSPPPMGFCFKKHHVCSAYEQVLHRLDKSR